MNVSCRRQNIYTGTRGCTNVYKQAQYFYIMTRPLLAPSILSFFCFRSSTCFALRSPLKWDAETSMKDYCRESKLLWETNISQCWSLILDIPCLDLVLFVIFLMRVWDQWLVSRCHVSSCVFFGLSKRLQFTYKENEPSRIRVSTDTIFQQRR